MTGDEYLERGVKLRRAQEDVRGEILGAKQGGVAKTDPHLRSLMQRFETVTAEVDAITREFLEG